MIFSGSATRIEPSIRVCGLNRWINANHARKGPSVNILCLSSFRRIGSLGLFCLLLAPMSPRRTAAQTPSAAAAKGKRLRILVVNGPNINLLGKRQPEIYGTVTLAQIQERMKALGDTLNVDLIFVQSNSEGTIVDTFQQHWDDVDAAIINSAGYSQHSIAIHDVIEAVPYPTFEVHLSNIAARDRFHQDDVIMPVCKSAAVGFGWRGYLYALQGAVGYLQDGGKK